MPKRAVLFLNLGSPESTKVGDVRNYLREFLSDPRVIDRNPVARFLILNLFILPFRPKRSAEAYSRIWTAKGSPLITSSQAQRTLVQDQISIPVALAMRYGRPSIPEAVGRLAGDGIESLFVIPLYPHYAMSSYETVVVRVEEVIEENGAAIATEILQPFYADTGYIEALATSVEPHLEEDDDRILFSFHGLPERHLRKTDPSHAHCLRSRDCCQRPNPAQATCYRHQCLKTVELLAARLAIPEDRYSVSFQSRLGRRPWLKPYTDRELERFAHDGLERIKVVCPAFVSDCLETLEEIAMRGNEIFTEAGGKTLNLIPCLNTHPKWIRFLVDKIRAWTDGSA